MPVSGPIVAAPLERASRSLQRFWLDLPQVGKPRKVKIRLNSQTLATPSPDMSAACVQSPKRQRRAISNKMNTPKP